MTLSHPEGDRHIFLICEFLVASRQGYGRQILQAAVERCIERGFPIIPIDALVKPIKKIVKTCIVA